MKKQIIKTFSYFTQQENFLFQGKSFFFLGGQGKQLKALSTFRFRARKVFVGGREGNSVFLWGTLSDTRPRRVSHVLSTAIVRAPNPPSSNYSRLIFIFPHDDFSPVTERRRKFWIRPPQSHKTHFPLHGFPLNANNIKGGKSVSPHFNGR